MKIKRPSKRKSEVRKKNELQSQNGRKRDRKWLLWKKKGQKKKRILK